MTGFEEGCYGLGFSSKIGEIEGSGHALFYLVSAFVRQGTKAE